jgi:ParB family chromosome partitioning protein
MKIPISKIRFNPENPRHFINPDSIDSLAACMKADGQLESVKTRKLTPQDTPSQGCTGTEPAEYEVFEGERRLRAAIKLGWTEIEAEVFTGSRDDFSLKGFMNNNGEPYLWLDKYAFIVDYGKKHKDCSQRQIAAKLDIDHATISHAVKVMALLNEAAKGQIGETLTKTPRWDIPESVIIALSGLAKSQPDKDGKYSTEDVDNMGRSLKVLIAGKMPEKQAKKLALWVKRGGKPEDFGEGGNTHPSPPAGEGLGEGVSSDGPYARQWQELRETGYFQIKPAKAGIHIIIPDEDKAIVGAFMAAGGIWALEHPDSAKASSGKWAELGNPYLEDIPGMIQQIKACDVPGAACDGDGTHLRQEASAGEPETRNQKLETSGNSGNGPLTMVKGILDQKIISTSADPIDQLKAKALNAGVGLLKKGAKSILKHLKKNL